MKNFLVAIVSEGLFSLVALLVMCAIVWFGGDYLGYPVRLRIMVMVVILVVWLVLYLIQRVLAVRRAMKIEAMLRTQSKANPVLESHGGSHETMAQQFRLGVQALRATRAGKAAVQHMPWFLLIGPPGAGKTAAVRESGLNFPFVGLGHRANAAAGATRAIDWWHADKAVFLDTSGSYIGDPKRHGEWLSLIRLLGRTGRTRPIDGVVLVVSIAELLALEEDRIVDHAQHVRDRMDELAARLGMTFPIHLVFSHCDQLHGFSDFFAHFSAEQRAQAWGCTFDWQAAGPQGLQGSVDEEFRRLSQVLGMRRMEALAAANVSDAAGDQQQNALLFPIQFALLQKRVGNYIAALMRPNPFQECGRLRGFWFTSAAQGGAPIDQVLSSIGLDKANLPSTQLTARDEQRSYFLNGPFAHIIPADQGLARISARALRRHRQWCTAAAALSIGAAAAASIVVYRGYLETTRMLERLIVDGSLIRTPGKNAAGENVATPAIPSDLFVELQRFAARDGIPLILYPGLQFTEELSEKARAISARPLIAAFTSRLATDLSHRLAEPERTLAGYENLHARLRMYLMLCGQVPVDAVAVQGLRTSKLFGDDSSLPLDHLNYIVSKFAASEWSASPDATLVTRATAELRDALWIPLTGVEIDHTGANLYPDVDLATLLPNRPLTAFVLERPLPGYYTQAAWDGFVAHAIDERAQALAQRFAELHIDLTASAIGQRLRARYEQSFTSYWRELPGHVRMTPPRTLDDAIAALGAFGHEGSLYRAFIVAWQQHQTLVSGVTTAVVVPVDEKATAKQYEWIDQTLNTVGILHAALAAYATNCPADARIGNSAELDKAITACAAFSLHAEEALAAYPEEVARRAFITHMRQLAENARIALECEPLLEAVKPNPGMTMGIAREDLARRLLSVGIPEFPRLWTEIFAGLAVPRAENPAAAAARLATLSAPKSQFAHMLRAAWRGQKVKTQLIDAQGAALPEQAWVETCMKSLAALSAAYAPAVDVEPGPRIARTDILKHLAETFVVSEREINAALSSIADVDFRAAVARPLLQIQDDARRHLFAMLAADADKLWDERVRGYHQQTFAGNFPFAEVATEADPEVVSAFFAPKSGELWKLVHQLDAASEIVINNQPLITCTLDYHRAVVGATALSEAIFAPDTDHLSLSFAAELRPRMGVFQAEVTLGKEQLKLAERPDNRRTFTVPMNEPLSCRIALQVANGRWLEATETNRPWGLLRWAMEGNPQVETDGRLLFTWMLVDGVATGSARACLIQLAVDQGPAMAVLSRRVFKELSFPTTITIRPQE